MVRLGESRYRAENRTRCLSSPLQSWSHAISHKIHRLKRPTPQREAPGKPPHVSLLPQYSWRRRCARQCGGSEPFLGLIERRELAAKRRESVRRRPRAGPEGPVLRRWLPCRRPCGAANGRAPAARSLAFGVWGVLHFRECWRRLGGGGPVRGAGVFGTLICTH